jgi:hypothetical protein
MSVPVANVQTAATFLTVLFWHLLTSEQDYAYAGRR